MKQDYLVLWSELAEAKLLDKADYIYHDSQDECVAEKFLETIRSMAERLSFVAAAYADRHFHKMANALGLRVEQLDF